MTRHIQPICKGTDANGGLIWDAVPMADWQTTMMALAVRAAAIMCPIKYVGDFLGFWRKVEKVQKEGRELDCENFGGFKAYVWGAEGERIMERNKRKHHRGD